VRRRYELQGISLFDLRPRTVGVPAVVDEA
jgi:hypothetical protein